MSEANDAGSQGSIYKLTLDGDGMKVAKEVDADLATEVLSLVMSGSNSKHAATAISSASSTPSSA